jgi:hypothetical protein
MQWYLQYATRVAPGKKAYLAVADAANFYERLASAGNLADNNTKLVVASGRWLVARSVTGNNTKLLVAGGRWLVAGSVTDNNTKLARRSIAAGNVCYCCGSFA